MNPLVQRQQEHNAQTRDAWEHFSQHRQRVTQLLQPIAAAAQSTLCVFGAGNLNDLDLSRLLSWYKLIDLVDLDEGAMREGLVRQRLETDGRIRLHGNCDVTGILGRMATWHDSPPEQQELARVVQAALAATPAPGQYSVVASLCLMSQLIHSVVLALGAGHSQFVELMSAVRLKHLRLLAEAVQRGGRAVLVTDVVSSESAPLLGQLAEEQLAGYVRECLEQRNFFHGTNPAVIAQLLQSDPQLAELCRGVRFTPPWRWNLGPRLYAVYAVQWERP